MPLTPTVGPDTFLIREAFSKIFKFLFSAELQEALLPFKIFFLISGTVFLFMTFYFLIKTDLLRWTFLDPIVNFLFFKELGPKTIKKKWQKIRKNMEKPYPEQWKSCLLEAAHLLNNVLKDIGFEGQDLNARLAQIAEQDLPNIKEVINSVKICDDIVRDPDYELNKETAHKVLSDFENALKYLEFL